MSRPSAFSQQDAGVGQLQHLGALRPALEIDKGGALLRVGRAWQDDVSALCTPVAVMPLHGRASIAVAMMPLLGMHHFLLP